MLNTCCTARNPPDSSSTPKRPRRALPAACLQSMPTDICSRIIWLAGEEAGAALRATCKTLRSTTMSLQTMPSHVLINILAHLDAETRLRAREVSKRLKIISRQVPLQLSDFTPFFSYVPHGQPLTAQRAALRDIADFCAANPSLAYMRRTGGYCGVEYDEWGQLLLDMQDTGAGHLLLTLIEKLRDATPGDAHFRNGRILCYMGKGNNVMEIDAHHDRFGAGAGYPAVGKHAAEVLAGFRPRVIRWLVRVPFGLTVESCITMSHDHRPGSIPLPIPPGMALGGGEAFFGCGKSPYKHGVNPAGNEGLATIVVNFTTWEQKPFAIMPSPIPLPAAVRAAAEPLPDIDFLSLPLAKTTAIALEQGQRGGIASVIQRIANGTMQAHMRMMTDAQKEWRKRRLQELLAADDNREGVHVKVQECRHCERLLRSSFFALDKARPTTGLVIYCTTCSGAYHLAYCDVTAFLPYYQLIWPDDEAVGPNAPEGTAITLATWAAIWKLEGFLQKLVREGKSEDRRLGSIKQELASLWAQQAERGAVATPPVMLQPLAEAPAADGATQAAPDAGLTGLAARDARKTALFKGLRLSKKEAVLATYTGAEVVSVQCNDETPLFGEFIVATERVRWRDHEGEWREDSPTNFCAAAGMKSPKDWPKNIRVCPDELLEARGALITIRWFLENVKRPAAANPNPFIGAQAVYLYRKRQRAELERLHPTTSA